MILVFVIIEFVCICVESKKRSNITRLGNLVDFDLDLALTKWEETNTENTAI